MFRDAIWVRPATYGSDAATPPIPFPFGTLSSGNTGAKGGTKRNNNMTIESLWQEYRATPFPKVCRGGEVDGIDFVLLDADIAGCVTTFLESDRSLDLWRTAILGVCYRDVSQVLPQMPAEGRRYFELLEGLARLVLDDIIRESGKRQGMDR